MKPNITPKEACQLSSFIDGMDAQFEGWLHEMEVSSGKELSGVVGSLVKKGLIDSTLDQDGVYDCYWIVVTNEGRKFCNPRQTAQWDENLPGELIEAEDSAAEYRAKPDATERNTNMVGYYERVAANLKEQIIIRTALRGDGLAGQIAHHKEQLAILKAQPDDERYNGQRDANIRHHSALLWDAGEAADKMAKEAVARIMKGMEE
jgi:hypothetical protein